MLNKFTALFGTTALAAAALFLGAGEAQAQRGGHGGGGHGGGGHGGGGHGGGFHGGGFHGGGFHGGAVHGGGFHGGVVNRGFSGGGFRGSAINRGFYGGGLSRGYLGGYRGYAYRPYYGGYGYGRYGYGRYGFYRPYYGLGYGYGGYGLLGLLGYALGGYGYPYGYGYGSYAPYYGGYYGYDGYGSYAPYYNGNGYGYDYPDTSTGVVNNYNYANPALSSTPAQAPVDNAIHLQLMVPENAQVLFNGAPTTQTGTVREFVSPPLTPGQSYTYHVTVRYTGADGRPVEETRDVVARPNDWFTVDFTQPAPTAQPPAAQPGTTQPPAMPPAAQPGTAQPPAMPPAGR
jgi:uncharacterized protein (TIGR03000 family)